MRWRLQNGTLSVDDQSGAQFMVAHAAVHLADGRVIATTGMDASLAVEWRAAGVGHGHLELRLTVRNTSASAVRVERLLPLIAEEYGVTAGAAAAAVTAFALSYGLLQVICGPLGDRYGRYRTIAAAAFVSAFGSAACACRTIAACSRIPTATW